MNDKRQRPVLGVLSGTEGIDSLITTMADVQPGYALNQPCGRASDTFHIGELEGIKVVVLKQHGKHH